MNSLLVFAIIVSILTFLMVACLFYAFFMHASKISPSSDLIKPSARQLKPWSKQEKKKPKVNDDDLAWKKQNNLE